MENGNPKPETAEPAKGRRRPGARKLQILQTLAAMLEDPRAEKVTTAALAARLEVSEAALYRHFASKSQMYEGLIEFIETTIFGLINDIAAGESSGCQQVRRIVRMLLEFAQANRGMTRVLIGDALVNENERLQERMNQFYDRVEASLKQALRVAVSQGELAANLDVAGRASLAMAFVAGRWHRFSKSGFRRMPSESLEQQLLLLAS
jgi:TetR/AcrR family transcriptional regulator